MGKRDLDRRVAEALKALTATKEDSIRDLAEDLDKIEAVDVKIAALNKTRNELITAAEEKNEAAKTAGWKVRELSDAGLVVPRATAAAGETPTRKARTRAGARPAPSAKPGTGETGESGSVSP